MGREGARAARVAEDAEKGTLGQAVELVGAGKKPGACIFRGPVRPITNTKQAAAYQKHIQSYHLEIVRSLTVCATAEAGRLMQTAFTPDESLDEDDSEYESDSELEFEDQSAYNQRENERQDHFEWEYTSEPQACGLRFTQEMVSGTSSPLQDIVTDTEGNLVT